MMEYYLSDLFDLEMGKTPSRSNPLYWKNPSRKWISIGDLSNSGKFISKTKEWISEEAVRNCGIKEIPANTVVMSFKLSIGKTAITAEPMFSNEAIMSFRDKHIVDILPDYLYYMFSGLDWNTGTNKAVKGKTLNKTTLSRFKIKLHNIREQRNIVNVLDNVCVIIKNRKEQLDLLDNLAGSRFFEIFGDPVKNPKKFPVKTLPEIGENLDYRRIPITSCDRKEGKYPYYGASGIVDYVEDYIFDEDILLISEDGANLLARVTPIAFSVSGKVWVNNHAHVMRFDNMATQIYVERLLNLIDISHYVTGTAQPKLNQAKLNSIPIPVPDEMSLREYLEIVEQINKTKSFILKSLEKTQLLFDSLLQKYFG